MSKRREIDERDIDKLLEALTDLQIAATFGLSVAEVSRLRQSRRSKTKNPEAPPTDNNKNGSSKALVV
ncbi:MAG: hypothetical protein GY789_23095 [Hyphomicrobiales bacterium]|nr:hypothetical protein [Hyphomicrobiales bacterium]